MSDVINTSAAPAAIGPYSQAMKVGNFIFTSGQLPLSPSTGEMPQSIQEQTKQSLLNVKAILESAGVSLKQVVKTTVFLSDLANFAPMNEVYSSFFEEPFPARSCFEVARLPKDALVEIEVVATSET